MPELPEVETIRRQLAPLVEGRALEDLAISDPRWTMPLDPKAVCGSGERAHRRALDRRGKYLIWELSDDVFLMVHLRMTGTLLYDPGERPAHSRVRFGLGDGHELWFVDPRRFGTGELAIGEARDAFLTRGSGSSRSTPRSPSSTSRAGRGCRAPVKAFLLDQKRIAGVGNIYADEALFRARIHPLRLANRLTGPQLDALRMGVIESLEAGIAAKGATIDDFRDPDGVSGTFQNRFLIHLRAGEPCVECGRTVEKLVAAGRGTYVCRTCQPVPRRRPGG